MRYFVEVFSTFHAPHAHTKEVGVEGKDELDSTSCYKALLFIKREHRALATKFKCKVLNTVQY